MTRLERFKKLADHPYLGREFSTLPKRHVVECEVLLEMTKHLTDDEYIDAANRWKLDQPDARDKHYPTQWGLLIQAIEPQIKRGAK